MKQSLTSFQIKHGLFQLDFTDHYAILGIPLGTDEKQVRKRYLQIVRSLHPDKCKAKNKAEKEYANQILSKLVNPAYEHLYKKNLRVEYQLVLQHIGQRLTEEEEKVTLITESAKKLAQAGEKAEIVYNRVIQALALEQYKSLENVINIIAQMSELNLIYLKLTAGKKIQASSIATPKISVAVVPQAVNTSQTPPPEPEKKSVDPYIRRAQEYIEKNNFAKARIELEDAFKIETHNSSCTALKGLIYLKQNQLTSARIFINKAWKANEKDPIVIKCKQQLDKVDPKAAGKGKNSGSSDRGKSSGKSENSGIFRSLFGGKKK
ncbi:MAG: DnaJ domain-containing protein [Prochloraceae cyanobacterium]